jgi:RNase P/RNase MRP subunit POP5
MRIIRSEVIYWFFIWPIPFLYMKLKSKPTLRDKHKYVVFKIHSSAKLQYSDVKNAVMNALLGWMGERDFAEASIWLIKNLWDAREQKGFIRCAPKYTEAVKMSLLLIHQIGDEKVAVQSLWVSGTIKSGKDNSATAN